MRRLCSGVASCSCYPLGQTSSSPPTQVSPKSTSDVRFVPSRSRGDRPASKERSRSAGKELRRRGMAVNHKRVARIMREDNLLAVQPRQFVVTTKSDHKLEVYLNLARRMKLTGIDQLWVADITYIRLKTEFVYLAVILDGFSRKVVGWSLERSLASRLAIAALEQAIVVRQPPWPCPSLRSWRAICQCRICGSSRKYGMIPSMSRPANPYDNAVCESFLKTLKREEILRKRRQPL